MIKTVDHKCVFRFGDVVRRESIAALDLELGTRSHRTRKATCWMESPTTVYAERIPITGLHALPLWNITSTSEFRHKHALPSNLQLTDYCCSCRSESATCYQSLRKQPIDGHTGAILRVRPWSWRTKVKLWTEYFPIKPMAALNGQGRLRMHTHI